MSVSGYILPIKYLNTVGLKDRCIQEPLINIVYKMCENSIKKIAYNIKLILRGFLHCKYLVFNV